MGNVSLSLRKLSIFITVLFFLVTQSVFAQRPPVAPINLNYLRVEFIHPGARPAALGGAFIGAAQDESAAPINPAGLTYLKSAGATLNQHHIRTDFDEPEGSPTQPNLRTNFQTINFNQTMVGIFVPLKRVTFAAFRALAFDSRYNFETRQFLTTNSALDTRQVLGGLGNFPGKRVNLDLEMINDAVSISVQLHRRLSVGFTLKTSVLNFRLDEQTYLDPGVETGKPPGPNSARTTYSITTLDERNVQPGITLGLLTQLLRDRLFLGAVLDFNPKFDLESQIFLPEYKLSEQNLAAESPLNRTFDFRIPDVFGVGLYYIAQPRLRFTLDLRHIQYSDLLDGNNLNAFEDDIFNEKTRQYEDPDGRADLTVEDATEIHVGVEYLFKASRLGLVPLRFGVYTNPGHRIHAANNTPDLQRLFPKARDRTHVTFGAGLVFNSYLKFDGALNISRDDLEIIGSTLISIPF